MKHTFHPGEFSWEGVQAAGYKATGERDGEGFRGVTRLIIWGANREP